MGHRNSYSLEVERLRADEEEKLQRNIIKQKHIEKQNEAAQEVMRADWLIHLSKGFMERCFLKFDNYFLEE